MTAAVLISAEPSGVNMVLFRRTTRGGRHLIYRLAVLQQPERARACGSGQKSHTDRRPIDPPPVMELRIYEAKANLAADPKDSPEAMDITFNYNANFFLYATLEHARQMAHGRGQSSSANTPPVLTGMPVSGMAYLDRPTEAGYFLFPDLSVRHEGRYKLVFNLYEQTKNEADCDLSDYPDGGLSQTSPSLSSTSAVAAGDMEPPSDPDAHFNWRMEIKSAPFSVYSAKKFPGLAQSTDLSKTVAEQGCRVRIRREVRMRKRDGKRGGDGGDDAEYQRGRASATPEPYRARSLSNASDRSGYPDSQGRRPSVHDYQMPPPPPGYGPPVPAGSHLYFGNKPQFAQPGLLPQQQPPSQSLQQQQQSLQYPPLPPPPPVSPSTPYSRQSNPSPYQTPTQPVGPYGGGGGYGQQRSSVSHHPYQYQQQQHYQHPLPSPSPHDMYDRRSSGALPPLPSPSVAYGASESDRRADYGPPSTGSSCTALPSFTVAGDHHHSHPHSAAPHEAPTPTRAAAVPSATQLPSIAALTSTAPPPPPSSLPPLPPSSRCGTPVQLSSFASVGSSSHSRTKPIEALPDDAPLGPPPEFLAGAGTKRKRSATLEADDKPLYNGQRQSDPPRVDRSRNWRNTILNESSPMSTLARTSEPTVEAPPAPMRTLEYTTPRFASNSTLPDVSMVIPDAVLGTYTLSATYYLTPPPPRH